VRVVRSTEEEAPGRKSLTCHFLKSPWQLVKVHRTGASAHSCCAAAILPPAEIIGREDVQFKIYVIYLFVTA
jgi:hypothetical protein